MGCERESQWQWVMAEGLPYYSMACQSLELEVQWDSSTA